MRKKIAFCFLIYNIIEFENLWYNFFKNVDPLRYNIYIHSKEDYILDHFKDKLLKKCISTNWGHVSLVHATNLLFEEAYKDNENYKFVLLCGTTIPLKNFDYIYEKLTKSNKGIMNYISKNAACHQWIILNREIVKEVLSFGYDGFRKLSKSTHGCPDETLYYKFIKNNNLESNIDFKYDCYENLSMFVNWGNKNYKFNKEKLEKYPKNYESITKEEIDFLLNSECLFGRKFYYYCIIENTNITLSDYLLNFINNNKYKYNFLDDESNLIESEPIEYNKKIVEIVVENIVENKVINKENIKYSLFLKRNSNKSNKINNDNIEKLQNIKLNEIPIELPKKQPFESSKNQTKKLQIIKNDSPKNKNLIYSKASLFKSSTKLLNYFNTDNKLSKNEIDNTNNFDEKDNIVKENIKYFKNISLFYSKSQNKIILLPKNNKKEELKVDQNIINNNKLVIINSDKGFKKYSDDAIFNNIKKRKIVINRNDIYEINSDNKTNELNENQNCEHFKISNENKEIINDILKNIKYTKKFILNNTKIKIKKKKENKDDIIIEEKPIKEIKETKEEERIFVKLSNTTRCN